MYECVREINIGEYCGEYRGFAHLKIFFTYGCVGEINIEKYCGLAHKKKILHMDGQ